MTFKITHLLQAFFKCDFSYSYAAVDSISSDIVLSIGHLNLWSALVIT